MVGPRRALHALALIDGDGHTWIALDCRTVKADPSVVYVITDPLTILPLAPSFAAFLEHLLPDVHDVDADAG